MPSQIVAPHLPWNKPGCPSTADALLIHATAIHDAQTHAACGHASAECSDPATEGRWHVEPVRCHALAAVAAYVEDHKDLTEGQDVNFTTRLLDEGETPPPDPLRFDPERARAEWLAQRERFGLA